MRQRQVDSVVGGIAFDRFRQGKRADRRMPLRNGAFVLQMLDQWIEARVLGNDAERSTGNLGGKQPDIVGEVEIEGIVAGRLEENVLGISAKRMHGLGEFDRYLRLARAEKELQLELAAAQQLDIGRLNVFVVDQHEVHHPSSVLS